jgi:hypothetical protein
MENEVTLAFSSILTFLLLTLVLLPMSGFVNAELTAPVVEWSKTYTYGTYGGITAITATADSGYALAGYVVELGAPGQRIPDAWLLKIDSSGNKVWEQGLSDSYLNLGQVTSIIQASDGGYVMTCADLVKADATGNVQWKHAYSNVTLSYVIKTSDNKYALSGSVQGGGFWLAKADDNGNLQWSQTYGGSNDELSGSLVQTFDGGYALAGSTYSYVTGTWDMWLVRTDSNGKMLWNQTYSTLKDDQGVGVVQASDNGFVLAGSVDKALCLVKFESSGTIVWNQTYNQIDNILVHSIIKTNDGSYAVVADSGLIKIDASGNLQWSLPYDGTYAAIQKGSDYVLAGSVPSTSPGGGWIASTSATSVTNSPTPLTSQSTNTPSVSTSPTSFQSQPTNSSSNSSSAFDFVKSNYLGIIAVTAVILLIVVLVVKTQKRK